MKQNKTCPDVYEEIMCLSVHVFQNIIWGMIHRRVQMLEASYLGILSASDL